MFTNMLEEAVMGIQNHINFVKEPLPDDASVITLCNAKFVDVINGCFFKPDTRIQIKKGKIDAITGPGEAPAGSNADLTIDLKGKTVLPGLFNVHCHIQMINPTLFSDFKTVKARKKCTLAKFEKKELLNIFDNDADIGSKIYKNIAAELAERLKKANKDILKLTTAFSLALEG